MSLDSTYKYMRSQSQPKLIDRRVREDWAAAGGGDLYQSAMAAARELLATHEPEPLPAEVLATLRAIVEGTERELGIEPARSPSRRRPGTARKREEPRWQTAYESLQEAVIAGDGQRARELAQRLLDGGAGAREILDGGLLPGMDVVGQRMRDGECFIPEVLLSARTMQGALELLKPHLAEGDSGNLGTIVIGTVEGDVHDIGKNLVAMMLEGRGIHRGQPRHRHHARAVRGRRARSISRTSWA